MVLSTGNKDVRVQVRKDNVARMATVITNQRTPDGWEEQDREDVELSVLREVLREWFDIPEKELRKV